DGNANGDDDDGNANGDDDNGNGNGDDDHDTVNANGDDGSNANAGGGNNANGGGDNVELEAHLFGAGGAAGEVRYRVEGDRRRFEIEVEGVAAGAYDVSIGGVVVASLSVGSYGDGSLELDTLDGTFPAGFPDQVNAADVVSVGDVLSGALQLDDS
ncbi:MAG: hypothetical protein ACE5E6_12015, partial [Phycisphaerae bacterium]